MRTLQEKEQFSRVRSITVKVGALQLVVPEALDTAFSALTKGTVFEGANLVQEVVRARAVCHDCGTHQSREQLFDPCRACGSYNLAMLAGMELNISHLEVEDNV